MKVVVADNLKIFKKKANMLIILQQGPFLQEDILKQYYIECGRGLNQDFLKKVMLEQLNHLASLGIVNVTKGEQGIVYSVLSKNNIYLNKIDKMVSDDKSGLSIN